MVKNEKGFSLVQILVAAGMMGGLTLVFLQFIKNTNDVQVSVQAKSEEMELRTSIRMILDDERYCRVSIAGNGPSGFPISPVTFKKENIDSMTEGLDVSLYISNQAGDTRTLKKFNGANNPGTSDKSSFGKLSIKSIKLIMNNPITPGPNYPNSANHSDVGILRVLVERKISMNNTREVKLDFDLIVGMSTGQTPESPGVTRILTCTRKKEEQEEKEFKYPENCSMTFAHSDSGQPFRSATLAMNSGGLIGVRLRGDVNSDDRFQISSNCGSGNELDDYFSSCSVGFGWKDNTNGSSVLHADPNPLKAYNAMFGSTITLQTGGDVNQDDSFYYRIKCPNGTNSDLNKYVKSKCQICFGHTDEWRTSPDNLSCKKIQNQSDESWGRVLTAGDVGADDALFLGFFCEGEYSPIIKQWSY